MSERPEAVPVFSEDVAFDSRPWVYPERPKATGIEVTIRLSRKDRERLDRVAILRGISRDALMASLIRKLQVKP